MPIDTSKVGWESEPMEVSWNAKDCMLYALGVGSGTDELEFSTEKGQKVLPAFAVVPGMRGMSALGALGDINFAMLVHGEQGITLHRDLPPDGKAAISGKITAIWDKGSGAVIETEGKAKTSDGQPLFDSRASIFIRGEGGFGGERGPSGLRFPIPEDRAADHKVTYTTREDQALLYRLSGDMNPLHADPEFAAMGGFPKPILHGLCTYGFTGRALLFELCGGDPSKFASMDARFSKPVYPGETLEISVWDLGNNAYAFRTSTSETVLDGGRFTTR